MTADRIRITLRRIVVGNIYLFIVRPEPHERTDADWKCREPRRRCDSMDPKQERGLDTLVGGF